MELNPLRFLALEVEEERAISSISEHYNIIIGLKNKALK